MLLDVLGKSVVADDVWKPQIKNYLEAKKAQSRWKFANIYCPFRKKKKRFAHDGGPETYTS